MVHIKKSLKNRSKIDLVESYLALIPPYSIVVSLIGTLPFLFYLYFFIIHPQYNNLFSCPHYTTSKGLTSFQLFLFYE